LARRGGCCFVGVGVVFPAGLTGAALATRVAVESVRVTGVAAASACSAFVLHEASSNTAGIRRRIGLAVELQKKSKTCRVRSAGCVKRTRAA